MAKHTKGRRGRRTPLGVARVNESLAIGSVTTGVVIVGALTSNGPQRKFLLSAMLSWGLSGYTTGDGPIHVGLAHGDYTVAEIGEWFNATGALDTQNLVAQEQTRRKIRDAGIFEFGAELSQSDVLNEGMPMKTALKFILGDSEDLNVWVRNSGAGTLGTGAVLRVSGKLFYKNSN